MDGSARVRLFVYGTLRRGGSRDATVHYEGVRFLASAGVRGRLHDLGDYPGLRLDPGAAWVRGEIFDVTAAALARLDEWEGIGASGSSSGEYRRVKTEAHRDDGGRQTVWVYEIAEARCAGAPLMPTGDWLSFAR